MINITPAPVQLLTGADQHIPKLVNLIISFLSHFPVMPLHVMTYRFKTLFTSPIGFIPTVAIGKTGDERVSWKHEECKFFYEQEEVLWWTYIPFLKPISVNIST